VSTIVEHKAAGLDLAAFALKYTRPVIDELPDPWCVILAVARRERTCSCGETIDEYQVRFRMLAGANRGTTSRHYNASCPACHSALGGNYRTKWLV